jgi:hypothetical protein
MNFKTKKIVTLITFAFLGLAVALAYGMNTESFLTAIYDSTNGAAKIITTAGSYTGAVTIASSASVNTGGNDADSYIRGDVDEELLYVDAGNNRVAVSTGTPDRLFHVEATTAKTNTVDDPVRVTHETSGAPANGIGVGVEFEQETSAANNEVIMILDAVVDDVTAASEDASLSVKLMTAGAAAAEVFAVESTGVLTLVKGEAVDNTVDGTVLLTADVVEVSAALKLEFETADPCGTFPEGSLFYNDTANIPCYCDQAGADLKVSDDTACF